MQIGIPAESTAREARVAASPQSVAGLIKLGFAVAVAAGAGAAAGFTDEDFAAAGAQITTQDAALAADVVLKIAPPTEPELAAMKDGATLIALLGVAHNAALLSALNARRITALSLDCIPRISRAQSMDVLSSMANIAGYRAVVEASFEFGRFFTGQITAAGKIPPAKVLVIGAGVAGLAAIGAAGSLGAVVRAFDTRAEVKEQIESMGAEFLEVALEEDGSGADGYAKVMSEAFIKAEMELFAAQARDVDIIITTALIPGKPAPRLITAEMVAAMKRGSVVVDLAAANGGNCELTKKDELVVSQNGVKIIGYTDLPSRLPTQSSQLFATNLLNLLKLLAPEKNGQIALNFDDEIIRSATVCREGEITFPPPPIKVSGAGGAAKGAGAGAKNAGATGANSGANSAQNPATNSAANPAQTPATTRANSNLKLFGISVAAILFAVFADNAPVEFFSHFMVFALACIVGYYVVWNVSHALHTPLMSVTNAISGIIIIGALVQAAAGAGALVSVLAFVAILIVSINIFGGFVVTQRMLKMFKKD